MSDQTQRRIRDNVVPVPDVKHDQTVEIHWRLPDGKIFVEAHTCPPQATIEVKSHVE